MPTILPYIGYFIKMMFHFSCNKGFIVSIAFYIKRLLYYLTWQYASTQPSAINAILSDL